MRTGDRAPEARPAHQEILRAKLVNFKEVYPGRLVYILDNGQVWRQRDLDSKKVHLEKGKTVDVEIRHSGFGGYRMKVGDNIRILAVERVL